MERADILEKINELAQEVFEDDDIEITEETVADDVDGWDSLSHLEFIDAIESEFGIKLTMGEIQGSANVGELMDAVIKHMG